MVDNTLRESIVSWRKEIWRRDFGDSLLGPSVVLSNELVEAASSFGPIKDLDMLKKTIGGWLWFGKYGNELLTFLQSLEIAPKKPRPTKPRAPRGEKRGNGEQKGEDGGEEERTKRRRPDSETTSLTSSEIVQAPTAVNPCPTPVRPITLPHSTPSRPSTIHPFTFRYQSQITMPQTPLSSNPYAALATPSSSQFPTHPQFPYTSIPYPYTYYYPRSTPSSSYTPTSHQPSVYPKPPPPPST